MENNSSCQHIPVDIMANILLRLPAKSLAIFRCVCKQWQSIINGLDFLNAHRTRMLQRLRLINRWANTELVFYDFDGERKLEEKSFKIMLGGSSHYILSNIVDGITCAYRSVETADIYLLNLTSQTLVKSLRSSQRGYDYPANIGLGFDSSKGVYQIVRLFCLGDCNSCFCEVISLGESDVGEWRFIGEISQRLLYSSPIFLSGVLYWETLVCVSGLPSCLLTFDVEEEKLGSMVTPFEPPYDLMELDGHLCITCFDKFTGNLEVRILKDHTKSEWTRAYSIPTSNFIPNSYADPFVLGIADGMIFLLFIVYGVEKHTVHCYDLLDRTSRVLYDGSAVDLILHKSLN